MEVKASQAVRLITTAIQSKVVPMLWGSPGIGKSQIIYQIAEAYNLMVIDLRLSQCDPTDLAGFPTIEGSKADYVPMKHFPIEGDQMPINPKTGQRYSGWLLFLDEATSAPPAIQAAAYKLVLDRMVGSHRLHKNVAIVLAGNKETDGAIVHPMSTALQSRLFHLELVVDQVEWLDWGYVNKMKVRITDFIKFKPGNLYTFSADHTDHTYACPRTWEFANRLLDSVDVKDPDALPLLAGTISEGVAREFIAFCGIYERLLTIDQIQANPEGVTVPSEPSVIWALTGCVAQNMTPDNAKNLMKFVVRFADEYQVVCLREVKRKSPAMLKHPAVMDWYKTRALELF